MNDKQKAESYRRDLEKRSLQVVQLNKRIRKLESALRTIQREAHGIDQYLYDVASEALGDE